MVIDYLIVWYLTRLQMLKNLRIMNKQSPLFIALFFYGISLTAQNKAFDWSAGIHASIMSYSAVLENKLTNPYEYSIGSYISFSRYLNNNFDISIEGSRVQLQYPVGDNIAGGQAKYQTSNLYDASFTLKYKLDNGYILRENHAISPFIKIGAGATQVEISSSGLDYFFPVGLGLNVALGKRTSLSLQSTMKYSNAVGRTYAHQSLGLLVHFGKASHKRLQATRLRQRTTRYARIRKYRHKQKLLKNKRAKERLATLNLKQDKVNLASRIPVTEDLDQDLLVTAEQVVNNPNRINEKREEETSVDSPKSQPEITENTTITNELKTNKNNPVIEQPSIPQPPKYKTAEPLVVSIGDHVQPPPKFFYEETSSGSKLADILESEPATHHPIPPKVKQTTENQAYCQQSEYVLTQLGMGITFESDKFNLRPKTYRSLNQVVEVLNRCEGYSYVIIAHSDNDGNSKYNQKLSAKRAAIVKSYLVQKGIKPKRLITAAYGASLPVAPNTTAVNKEKNRRIAFKMNKTTTSTTLGNR